MRLTVSCVGSRAWSIHAYLCINARPVSTPGQKSPRSQDQLFQHIRLSTYGTWRSFCNSFFCTPSQTMDRPYGRFIFHVLVCAFYVYKPATPRLECADIPYPASALVHGQVMLNTMLSLHGPVRLPAKINCHTFPSSSRVISVPATQPTRSLHDHPPVSI